MEPSAKGWRGCAKAGISAIGQKVGWVMKYFVSSQGWEVRAPGIGRRWIEPGTLVDDSTAAWSWLAGQKPPPDAMPYDQATYDAFLAPVTQGGLGYEYWRVAPWAGGGIVLQGPKTGGDYWAQHKEGPWWI
jgi:hypothetical protein